MATYRTSVFPALDNKRAMDIVSRAVAGYFINLFPVNFFRYVYIDTLTGMPNLYITKNGSLEMVTEEVQQTEYPRLVIRIKPKANNVEETIFEKLISIYKYPAAQLIRSDNTLAFTFFDGDPYHIKISSMDDYTRSDIEFQIMVRTRDDQQAVANILATYCKKEYGYPFMVKTEYQLPSNMTEHIKRCIYMKELTALNNSVGYMTEGERNKIQTEIQNQFSAYLNQYSYQDIVPMDDNRGSGKSYLLRRGLRVYLNIEQWEKDEGNKKENVYENFSLTSSGYYECYHPITFLTTIPSIIRGSSNSKIIPTSVDTDNDGKVHTILSREAYSEERNDPVDKINMTKNWVKVFDEREIVFDNREEELIDIIDWIPEYDKVTKKTLELLVKYSTINEIRENVKIFVYEDRDVIDPIRYCLLDGMVLSVKNNDTDKCYYIEVYLNEVFMNKRLRTALMKEGV